MAGDPYKAFQYVDAHYEKKGKRSTWYRIKTADIETKLIRRAGGHNCFCTIQRYANAVQEKDEPQIVPLFFDLDDKENFSKAHEDAKTIVEYFQEILNINEEEMQVYFSGSKGFHVIINERVFGLRPCYDLTYVHKVVALWMKSAFNLTSIDEVAYSIRRQLRVPNTTHQSSGLRKIQLTPYELNTMTEAEIRKLATEPRDTIYVEDDPADLTTKPEAEQWYAQFLEQYKEQERIRKLAPRVPIKIIKDKTPQCIKDLSDNHIRKTNTRNRATIVLATYCKDTGISETDAAEHIKSWIAGIPPAYSTHADDERFLKASVDGVVRSVYNADSRYHFVCSYIKSLGSDEKPIACDYENCPFTSSEEQEPENPIELHLAEASRVEYFGKKLTIHAITSGKAETPFAIPWKVAIFCNPNTEEDPKNSCMKCKLKTFNGSLEKQFTAKNPDILEFLDVPKLQQKKALRRACRIPDSCKSAHIKTIEQTNIEELQLIPQIERGMDEREYVRRRAFYIGHGIRSNEAYEILTYSCAHPRTQHVVHIFSEHKTSQSDLGAFKISEDIAKQLRHFQVASNSTVARQWEIIHADLEANVTQIWNRRDMAYAMDLVWHSVLQFRFTRKQVERGWLDALILGDSGQAKSAMASALLEHYNLGYKVSGESASRTGLVYTIAESGGRYFLSWGVLPLNDKRLVVIDEFGGIAPEDIEKLSDVRSSGVAEAHRAAGSQKTNARTRLILMANSRQGLPLANFEWPVVALKSLIPKTEDIRRLDYAIGVKSGEVPLHLINRQLSDVPAVTHRFTASLCKLLILWAWSRRPEQIIFSDKATKVILGAAKDMGEIYSPEIPLVEGADQRLKIARVSAAVAARVFSTSDNELLNIEEEHVNFAVDFLTRVYAAEGLEYAEYSKQNPQRALTTHEFDEKKKTFIEFERWQELGKLLLQIRGEVRKSSLRDAMGYEKRIVDTVFAGLCATQIIIPGKGGFKKSPFGIAFLRMLLRGEEAQGDIPF